MVSPLMYLQMRSGSFSYGGRSIFKDLSLNVEHSSFHYFEGPNGSGKSTLIKCLVGLLKLKSGSIDYYSSSSIVRDPRILFSYLDAEKNGLFREYTALEHIKFYAQLNSWSRDRSAINETSALSLLESWNFSKNLSTKISIDRFSTGMKRKLGLACLEAQNKKIWFLDEPYHGLDLASCELLNQKISHHLKNGGSIILSCHDKNLVSSFNSRKVSLG